MAYPIRQQIANHLRKTRALSEEAVTRRSAFLAEDIPRIALRDFSLCPLELITRPDTGEKYMLVEYKFGPVPFSVENAKDPFDLHPTVEHMGGSGLDREELLYLSRVVEIARTLIPKHWFGDEKIVASVRSPASHLATLNEIWWLARWGGFNEDDLIREYRQNPASSKTVDWRFPKAISGSEWFLNVEVKGRVGSISDRSYNRKHAFYRQVRRDGTEDISDPRLKFCKSGANEINVLAITWYDQISTELEVEIQRFLDESDAIDVVAIWAPGDRIRGGWTRLFPRGTELAEKRRAFNAVLEPPDAEDHTRIMRNICPIPLPEILAMSDRSALIRKAS
jgi:hypothetical protein